MAYCGFLFDQCCCCLPLRGGLIAYGYFRMIIMTLLGTLFSYILIADEEIETAMDVIVIGGLVLEVLLTVVFLVGAHSESISLLKLSLWHFVLSTIFSISALIQLQYSTIEEEEIFWRFLNVFCQLIFMAVIASQINVAINVRKLIVKREEGENYKPLGNAHVIDAVYKGRV